MKKDLAYYMSLDYFKVVIEHADFEKYQVIYPQLPGCVGWGDMGSDISAVSENILKQWLLIALKDGYTIPEP